MFGMLIVCLALATVVGLQAAGARIGSFPLPVTGSFVGRVDALSAGHTGICVTHGTGHICSSVWATHISRARLRYGMRVGVIETVVNHSQEFIILPPRFIHR
jgi:hypothetical protein